MKNMTIVNSFIKNNICIKYVMEYNSTETIEVPNNTQPKNETMHIGEGTFGCVLKPPLKCINDGTTNITDELNKVSKIVNKKEGNIEFDNNMKMNAIDESFKYHLNIEKCEPDKSIENKYKIKKCTNKKFIENDNILNDAILLIMDYGGESLDKYVNEIKYNKAENIKKLWQSLYDLFDGLQLLQDNSFVHHDLKAANIVYNGEKAVFIDFGSMKTYADVFKSINSKEQSPWWNYPNELFLYHTNDNLLNYLNDIPNSNLNNMFDDDFVDCIEFKTITTEPKKDLEKINKDLENFFKKDMIDFIRDH